MACTVNRRGKWLWRNLGAGEGVLIIKEAPMATGSRALSKGSGSKAEVLLKAVGV